MNAGVDALAPRICPAIEVVQIRESDPTPETLLHMADGALDLAFRLGRVRFADACGNPNGDHEVGKTRIPPGFVLHHCQQHAFHAIGERHLGQATKVLKGLHEAADERRGIAALHKRHKAHTRIPQNSHKAVKFMRLALVFVHTLAPIKLDLLCWFGLIALNWRMASHRRAQRMDVFLQNADPSGVAQLVQALEEDLTIGTMILHDPLLDLLVVGIKFGRPGWSWFRDHGFWVLQICAHRRPRDTQLLSNLLHGLPLRMEIVYGIHGLTPKHGCSPEDVILLSFSLQPSWGSVNSTPARVYTVVNTR